VSRYFRPVLPNPDADRDVDEDDLAIFALHWLDDVPGGFQPLEGDLNSDSKVDFNDFAAFALQWLEEY